MKIPKTIKIKKCRLCKNPKLKQIYNFGNHYVSNFVNKSSIYKGIKAPLNLVYCKKCQLLQLEHSAPQEIMYKKSTGFRLIKFSHKHLKWVITIIDILRYMSSVNCLLEKSLLLYFFSG